MIKMLIEGSKTKNDNEAKELHERIRTDINEIHDDIMQKLFDLMKETNKHRDKIHTFNQLLLMLFACHNKMKQSDKMQGALKLVSEKKDKLVTE
jgi:hypothetical protein